MTQPDSHLITVFEVQWRISDEAYTLRSASEDDRTGFQGSPLREEGDGLANIEDLITSSCIQKVKVECSGPRKAQSLTPWCHPERCFHSRSIWVQHSEGQELSCWTQGKGLGDWCCLVTIVDNQNDDELDALLREKNSPKPFENPHWETAIWCLRKDTSLAPVYPRT